MFSDSSAPTQSSEVVLALFHPFREKMAKCEQYNVRELKDRIRLLQVLNVKIFIVKKYMN